MTGSGDPNAVVHFTVDGTQIASTVTANSSGIWTFTPSGLLDGSHGIVASETNTSGTGTASLTFTLDTKDAVAITSTGGSITTPTQTISGSVTDVAAVGTTVTILDGTTAIGTTTVQANGSWSDSITLTGNGTHTLTATDTDVAGNIGTSNAVVYTLGGAVTDTCGPGTTGNWSTAANWSSGVPSSASDAIILNSGLTVTGTAVANDLAIHDGNLQLYGTLTLGGSLSLGAGSVVSMFGGALSAQSITTDQTSLLSGYGTLSGAVIGDAVINADGGTLKIQGSLAGDTGSFNINSGATLELSTGTALSVSFGNSTNSDTLQLDSPAVFTGSLINFGSTDTLDLAGITASSATFNGSTLTINETNSQHLTYTVSSIGGSLLSNGAVQVASDGHGGTLVGSTSVGPTTAVNAGTSFAINVNASFFIERVAARGVPVTLTVTGTPTLQLNDGEVAGYTGGSGTGTLTFTYIVQPGDNVADLQVIGLNLPAGSSIVDSNGNGPPSGTITGDLGIQVDTTTVPATSVQQEILGLYAALYGRATDSGGVSYWTGIVGQQSDGSGVTTANAGSTAVTANDATVLGQQFVNTQNTYFNSLYGSLTDSAFINAMYVNIGGNAGDPGGVAYWAGLLQQAETAGQSVQAARAGLVGQFVHDLVDYNLAAGAAGLTATQLLAATHRQAAVDNKIAVSLALSDASQQAGGGILVVHAVGDAAYVAATTLIQGVTYNPATVTAAILGINNVIAHQDLTLI